MTDSSDLIPKCFECGSLGTRQPQLHIWPKGAGKKGGYAKAQYGVHLCDDCRLSVEMETQAFEAFREVCSRGHLATPGNYKTIYVKIGDPDYIPLEKINITPSAKDIRFQR